MKSQHEILQARKNVFGVTTQTCCIVWANNPQNHLSTSCCGCWSSSRRKVCSTTSLFSTIFWFWGRGVKLLSVFLIRLIHAECAYAWIIQTGLSAANSAWMSCSRSSHFFLQCQGIVLSFPWWINLVLAQPRVKMNHFFQINSWIYVIKFRN